MIQRVKKNYDLIIPSTISNNNDTFCTHMTFQKTPY